jgi:hypothetical protein
MDEQAIARFFLKLSEGPRPRVEAKLNPVVNRDSDAQVEEELNRLGV